MYRNSNFVCICFVCEAKFVFLILVTNLCLVCIWTSKNLLRYCKGKHAEMTLKSEKCHMHFPVRACEKQELKEEKKEEGKLKRSSRQVFTPLTIGSNSKGSFHLNAILIYNFYRLFYFRKTHLLHYLTQKRTLSLFRNSMFCA